MTIPETFFSVSEELRLFGLSCLSGAAFGLVWELLRTLRVLLPHNGFLTAAEDIAFFMLYAVYLMCFTTAAARGEFRVYYIVGGTTGFLLYILTLGSIVSAAVRKIIFAVGKVFAVVSSPIIKAFVLLGKKAAYKFVGISEIIVQKFKKIGLLLLYPARLLYNMRENKLGKHRAVTESSRKRNGNSIGEKIKDNKKIAIQWPSRKTSCGSHRNRLHCHRRDGQPRMQ